MRSIKLGRVQLLVLGFLLAAWLGLVGMLALAPEVYHQTLRLASGGNTRLAELLFLGALSAFILLVAIGALGRWRWIFWLLLVAFLSGVLRVPASILEVAGWIPATGPSWYLILQAVIGLVQFAIGVVMVIDYRRHGVWGRHT